VNLGSSLDTSLGRSFASMLASSVTSSIVSLLMSMESWTRLWVVDVSRDLSANMASGDKGKPRELETWDLREAVPVERADSTSRTSFRRRSSSVRGAGLL